MRFPWEKILKSNLKFSYDVGLSSSEIIIISIEEKIDFSEYHPLIPKNYLWTEDDNDEIAVGEKCQNSLFPNYMSNERERCIVINDPTHMDVWWLFLGRWWHMILGDKNVKISFFFNPTSDERERCYLIIDPITIALLWLLLEI